MSDRYIEPDEPHYIPPQPMTKSENLLIAGLLVLFVGLLAVVMPLLPPVTGF